MKHRPGMTPSQRARYNDKQRKMYLERELKKGRVPQPIKPAPWLRALYQQYGVDYAVYIPRDDMTPKQLRDVRNFHKALRSSVRDLMPADTTTKYFNKVFALLTAGVIDIDELNDKKKITQLLLSKHNLDEKALKQYFNARAEE